MWGDYNNDVFNDITSDKTNEYKTFNNWFVILTLSELHSS